MVSIRRCSPRTLAPLTRQICTGRIRCTRAGATHDVHNVWAARRTLRACAVDGADASNARSATYDLVHIHWLYNFSCIAAARAALASGVPVRDSAARQPRSASSQEEPVRQACLHGDRRPAAFAQGGGCRVRHARGRPTGVIRAATSRMDGADRTRPRRVSIRCRRAALSAPRSRGRRTVPVVRRTTECSKRVSTSC